MVVVVFYYLEMEGEKGEGGCNICAHLFLFYSWVRFLFTLKEGRLGARRELIKATRLHSV